MLKPLDIVATVSAARVSSKWLKAFQKAGATYFRINGAFESPESVGKMIVSIKRALGKNAPIWLDIPRNKIRLAKAKREPFTAGKPIKLKAGDANFPHFFRQIKKGDVLFAKDSQYRFEVARASDDSATLIARQDGFLTPGMGLHRRGGWDGLPLFSPHDLALLELARRHEVPYLGISYLRHAREIDEIRAQCGQSKPIFKIETIHAVEELPGILKKIDVLSIDRGDLSSEIGIENIHTAQRRIIHEAKARGARVFLATQLIGNMIKNPLPSISEVTSLHEAFEDGIDGLQLSEETARGDFAAEAIGWLTSLFTAWRKSAPVPGDLKGTVVWLTGLSGSGKTTLAKLLESDLKAAGHAAVLLDGDEIRSFQGDALGYEKKDRVLNQKNLIYLSRKLSETGHTVIVASLSPFAEIRSLAREKLPGYREVYLKCGLEECRRRDPKGHYARAQGDGKNFVGLGLAYDVPENPDFTVDTQTQDAAESLKALRRFLESNARAS